MKEETKEISYEETEQICKSNLEKAVFDLLSLEPFYGHLMQNLTRLFDKSMPTAAVTVHENRYSLVVNPYYFNSLTRKERVAILKHELLHLICEHLRRMAGHDRHIYNVSADMAINQWISDLPTFDYAEALETLIKNGLDEKTAKAQLPKPDKNGKCFNALLPSAYNLPPNKTSEWYYNAIMNNPKLKDKFSQEEVLINLAEGLTNLSPEEQEKLKQDLKDGKVKLSIGQGDHKPWDKVEGHTPTVLDEELKRLVRDAIEKSQKDFGSLPGSIQTSIMQLLTTEINWRARLRSFLQRATHVLRNNSRKRPSRRYGISFPGQKSDFKLNLCVFIDSSGSIGQEEAKIFGGEINRIWETGIVDVTLAWGDTEVAKTEPMKKRLTAKEFKLHGGGGTDAKPWLTYIDKNSFDAAVILTDGYFDFKLKKPKSFLMWALTEHGYTVEEFRKHIKFGKIIKLKVGKK